MSTFPPPSSSFRVHIAGSPPEYLPAYEQEESMQTEPSPVAPVDRATEKAEETPATLPPATSSMEVAASLPKKPAELSTHELGTVDISNPELKRVMSGVQTLMYEFSELIRQVKYMHPQAGDLDSGSQDSDMSDLPENIVALCREKYEKARGESTVLLEQKDYFPDCGPFDPNKGSNFEEILANKTCFDRGVVLRSDLDKVKKNLPEATLEDPDVQHEIQLVEAGIERLEELIEKLEAFKDIFDLSLSRTRFVSMSRDDIEAIFTGEGKKLGFDWGEMRQAFKAAAQHNPALQAYHFDDRDFDCMGDFMRMISLDTEFKGQYPEGPCNIPEIFKMWQAVKQAWMGCLNAAYTETLSDTDLIDRKTIEERVAHIADKALRDEIVRLYHAQQNQAVVVHP